jgi:hypothetical protein
MSHQLLFYDTKEKDLARDLSDFISELGVEIKMMPRSPEGGMTLDQKERTLIAGASGVVVLVTPGSTRDGREFASPSVNHEMGQARERFKETPAAIIYLVEDGCTIPTVDQTCYIPFNRNNMRSVVDALTHLIRNLKASGAIGRPSIPPRETPGVNVQELAANLDAGLTAEGSQERTLAVPAGNLIAAPSHLPFRYLGDYEVLEEIARGGMGIVFKARQLRLKRTVAIKMIHGGALASPQSVQRF